MKETGRGLAHRALREKADVCSESAWDRPR